jgi:2',3'-cyclic-nucleotide 2'-phosphodiesterase/3'-nucleotidase/5'-nucleotidase
VRTLGLKPTTETKTGFKDIQSFDWYQVYVNAAAEAGIVTGYDDQSFRPNQTISRQEMAVMIYRAMTFAGTAKADTNTSAEEFADAGKFEPWAKEAIPAMTAQHIIEGVAKGMFDPDATATRAQSAVILHRMLNQLILTNAK